MMKFVIHGSPIPQARHRTFMKGRFPKHYDPQSQEKQVIRNFLKKQLLEQESPLKPHKMPKEEQIEVELYFYHAIPLSFSQREKNMAAWGFLKPTQSDIDNLIKFIFDCSNKILFGDDRSIHSLKVKEFYSYQPRTEMHVMKTEISEDPPQYMKILAIYSPAEFNELLSNLYEIYKHADLEGNNDSNFKWTLPTDEDSLKEIAGSLSWLAANHLHKLKKISNICDPHTCNSPVRQGKPLC